MDEARARELIETRLTEIREERDRLGSDAAPTGYDDRDVGDSVDQSQREQGQHEEEALTAGLDLEEQRLEAALARVEDGTFGVDEVSGEPIEDERLELMPWTRRSAANAPDPAPDGAPSATS